MLITLSLSSPSFSLSLFHFSHLSPLSHFSTMTSLQDKFRQLEEATVAAQNDLLEKESKLKKAAEALRGAEAKLKALSKEAQENLQVNDTELPELIEAKALAQIEYDDAKKRYDTNLRYAQMMQEKMWG